MQRTFRENEENNMEMKWPKFNIYFPRFFTHFILFLLWLECPEAYKKNLTTTKKILSELLVREIFFFIKQNIKTEQVENINARGKELGKDSKDIGSRFSSYFLQITLDKS